MADDTLYRNVVAITYEYLGPAADRFVARQIRNHLGKDPEDLQKKDLKALIDWIGLAMRLLSNDMQVVDSYISDLQQLITPKKKRASHGK